MIKNSPKTNFLKYLSVLPIFGAGIDEVKAAEWRDQKGNVREVRSEDRARVYENALNKGRVWLADPVYATGQWDYGYQSKLRQPRSKYPGDDLSNWTDYIWLSTTIRHKAGVGTQVVMPRFQVSLPKNIDTLMVKTLWDNNFLRGNDAHKV